MKLPKIIGSSRSTRQERQQNLLKSNRQLMLTDNLFKIQPQKLLKDIINTTTDKDNTQDALNNSLYTLKTATANKLNESALVSSGRFVKSAQPKRLQRNRLHVTQKPACYVSRSTLASCSTPVVPIQNQNTLFMNSNGRKLNTDLNDSELENQVPVKQEISETPKTPQVKKNQTPNQTPSSSNRFSLSKLTKFVSRSALKVINRKSIGSTSSNSSSPDTSSSSSILTDDDEATRNVRKCLSSARLTDKEPEYNKNIYSSFEQQKQIEEKINKAASKQNILTRNVVRSGQPCMGITSSMLKQVKKQVGSSFTTGISAMPNAYLIGVPIVFNSENLKQHQTEEQQYDKLNRGEPVPFIQETRINKKLTKPIVKSLSSITAAAAFIAPVASPKLTSYKSTTLTSPVNSCRISVYSSRFSPAINKLEQQLHFESFSEAIF